MRPLFPAVIDNTMRATFASCPQKFSLEHLQYIAPSAPNVHLHAGGVFAKGIETYRRAFYEQRLNETECMALAARQMIIDWGSFVPPEKSNKTRENVIAAVDSYFETYSPQTDPIQPHFIKNKPCVEFNFAIPLPINHPESNEPIIYTGRFDMLGEFNKQLFVVDEKTTSSLGAAWVNQWKLRSQLTGYCWGAREYGYPVAGAIIRGISLLKNKFGHEQALTYRGEHMISRWYEQLLSDTKRMLSSWSAGYFDYNLADSCTSYGGCPYVTICESDSPDRWINSPYYRRRKWNPLTHTEDFVTVEQKEAAFG